MKITEYEPETGGILGIYTMGAEMAKVWPTPHVTGEYSAMEYYVDVAASPPAAKERPPQSTRQDRKNIAADGSEIMTLSGLPVPCRVEVNGESYEVDDGIFEWGTRRAGEYALRVVAFPFLDWEGTVTAG